MDQTHGRHRLLAVFAGLLLALLAHGARAEDPGWPREISLAGAQVVIFQPQLDAFEGNSIGARVAVAVTPAGASEQVFGAVWLESKLEIDRDTRTVTAYDILNRSTLERDHLARQRGTQRSNNFSGRAGGAARTQRSGNVGARGGATAGARRR